MRFIKYLIACSFLVLLIGCGQNAHHYKSSVVDYLYPDRDKVVEQTARPRLHLPLGIGVAFVPDHQSTGGQYHRKTIINGTDAGTPEYDFVLTENSKIQLLEKIRDQFENYEFVRAIKRIPSVYLIDQGSFENLEQLRKMFDIDVVVLVSYDQAQFVDEGVASLTYWTLIGAYMVPGEKNATHTMVDAVVYDIQSRSLLFHAHGAHRMKSSSTYINLSEQLRKDRLESFDLAAENLLLNLEQQLERFRKDIKQRPGEVTVIRNKM